MKTDLVQRSSTGVVVLASWAHIWSFRHPRFLIAVPPQNMPRTPLSQNKTQTSSQHERGKVWVQYARRACGVLLRMWVAGSASLKRRLGPPLRGVCAAVRWYSATSTSGVGEEPSTVKALHRQPEMLSRYEPKLIRNFRCALYSAALHRHRVQEDSLALPRTTLLLLCCICRMSMMVVLFMRWELCTGTSVYV